MLASNAIIAEYTARSSLMDTDTIRKEMVNAAKDAADDMYRRFGSTDMTGACGFAWVSICPCYKGNTKLGKAERLVLAKLGATKDWTGKNYEIWNPSGYPGQNVDIKEAGAVAAASVLKKYGFNAFANSRLD